jgi:hypothetical protein
MQIVPRDRHLNLFWPGFAGFAERDQKPVFSAAVGYVKQ